MSSSEFDSILFVSFGGPESEPEVMPFLRTVTAGRNIPDERLAEVAEHYLERDGRSPINDQNRDLIKLLNEELVARGIELPVYWGNRNWHPFLDEAMKDMQRDGRTNALAFVTSAYSSYSGCRQYREDIEKSVASTNTHIEVKKLRQFFNHPGFIDPLADSVREGLESLGGTAHILFSAHSIPTSMAKNCRYESQLTEAAELVVEKCGDILGWDVVYQSRSGRPQDPWLEPDINDRLKELASQGVGNVVICPIGFVSDHMEVVHDLDDEATETASSLDISLYRSKTPGTDSRFVSMIADLVLEQLTEKPPTALGTMGAVTCMGSECCLSGATARR